MTSTYKILGQLYYGPEINETPEIPGTSGYYTYTRGARDSFLTAFSKYTLSSQVDSFAGTTRDGVFSYNDVALYNQPSPVEGMSFQKNKFISVVYGGTSYLESYDGINWNQVQLGIWGWLWKVAVSNTNYHVAVKTVYNYDYNGAWSYSSNGITWTLLWLNGSIAPTAIVAANDMFYLSVGQTLYKFKTIEEFDASAGIQMSHSIGNSDSQEYHVRYVNGIFYTSINGFMHYSIDHINWYQCVLNNPWIDGITIDGLASMGGYDGNKFIGLTVNNQPAVSQDGVTWDIIDTPSKFTILYGLDNAVIRYANSIYMVMSRPDSATNVSQYSYSSDLINWVPLIDMPRKFNYIETGEINTLEEIQVSIGGQGTPGSYVEIVEPQVLYTVPAGKQVIVSSIFVTNHDTVARTYDLAVVPAGETLAAKHHIKWDYAVASNDFNMLDQKITMNAGDSIYVFPSTVNKLGFTALGVEIS